MNVYTLKNQKITLEKELAGTILDIGGGGEGIIGLLYGQQVTAIDRRQDELDETNNESKKMLMDARNLTFENLEFDHITSFFTLMYMNAEDQLSALKEAYRVLKPNGTLTLWDVTIPNNSEDFDIFIIELEVELPNKSITTGYGVAFDKEYSVHHYINILEEIGFKTTKIETNDKTFRITSSK